MRCPYGTKRFRQEINYVYHSIGGMCLRIAKGLVSLATQAPLCLDKVKSELFKHFVFICELEVSENSPKAREFQSLLVCFIFGSRILPHFCWLEMQV